ncbi:class I adenylate-forming enzyme family protein [Lysinibacillus sp. RSDA_15]|uniref:class I adenylate-forming enzyme family protein n=1 Tax=Lysinibacillus TaxID=400634 RepID=UPI0018CF5411|nr:class I adenylate-forming enzyme family protein [Lysinibacillus sphaericus]MBG9754199.1 hypothetical protein [Lysinibacillus sphaericus]QTB15738.1 acyl--CoA ligase [Lysinibacillus sphaericus]
MKYIGEILKESCINNQNKIALIYKNIKITYGQLLEHSNILSSRLGSKKHIGICFTNPLNFAVAYLSSLINKNVVLLIPNRCTLKEAENLIHNSNCDLVLTDKKDFYKLDSNIPVRNIDEIDWDFSGIGNKETYKETAILLQTSGSTSTPKIVMLSHLALYENALAHNTHLEITSENVALVVTPLTSSYGHTTQFLSQLLIGGTLVFLPGPFTVGDFYCNVNKYNVISTGLVAAQIRLLINSNISINIDSLNFIVCAGGPVSDRDMSEIKNKLPKTEVLRAYGLTEAGPRVTCCRRDNVDDLGTSGVPLCNVNVKIKRKDGSECREGQVGEIWVQSPSLFQGYYLNYKSTNKIFKNGWLKTGDMGFLKAQRLTIIGRDSNKLIIGGYTVFLEEIEEFFMQITDIKDVQVYSESDALMDEKIVVDCVLNRKSSITQAILLDICKQNLSSYKVPYKINIVESIIRSESGKLIRKK